MKKIDKLVATSFMGPYLAAFFVAEFVLLMQFLWKQIDSILGKGISMFNILELLSYLSVTLIPMAIPLTILISSVLVFGNMAERYELSSIKSAGVSLWRIMRAGMAIAVMTCLFSIIASNYLVPKSNLEFLSRFDSIKKAKPSMTIEQGIFNKDFKGFAIRVSEKLEDGKGIKDVLIYDHSDPDKSLINVIRAKSGEMFVTDDGAHFIMNLHQGIQYKELKNNSPKIKGQVRKKKYPFMRVHFDKMSKVFDMDAFNFSGSSSSLQRKKFDLLNSFQLYHAIDSMDKLMALRLDENLNLDVVSKNSILKNQNVDEDEAPKKPKYTSDESFKQSIRAKKRQKNSTKKARSNEIKYKQLENLDLEKMDSFLETFDLTDAMKVLITSYSGAIGMRDKIRSVRSKVNLVKKDRRMYMFTLNQKYSVALICLIFLFIGAPLGSIVKKGGYGYPLLFAILFYMIFMISFIAGVKLNRSESASPIFAAWLPCIVLTPIAVFLTIKAMNDSRLFDFSGSLIKLKSKLYKSNA